MISATFNFVIKNEDAAFDNFNRLILKAAMENPGFRGRESWRSEADRRVSVVYYWDSLDALDLFANHPDHLAAKRRYHEWYSGYEVIVAEIVRRYGDGQLPASHDTEAPQL